MLLRLFKFTVEFSLVREFIDFVTFVYVIKLISGYLEFSLRLISFNVFLYFDDAVLVMLIVCGGLY